MNAAAQRRRRIAWVLAGPFVAALVVGWLESRTWLVVQNATGETRAGVRLSSAQEVWPTVDLEPEESRRWEVTRRDVAALAIDLPGEEAATVVEFHPEAGSVTFVRLERGAPPLVRTERSFWTRWFSW